MNKNRQKELRSMVNKYSDPLSSLIEQSCDYIERMESQLSELKAENEALKHQLNRASEDGNLNSAGEWIIYDSWHEKTEALLSPSEGE